MTIGLSEAMARGLLEAMVGGGSRDTTPSNEVQGGARRIPLVMVAGRGC